jgi:hypothetical protein
MSGETVTNNEPVPDRNALAGALRDAFPDYREAVDKLVAEIAAFGGFSEYSLLSEVFRWGVLEAAVESGEEDQIRAAFAFVERLLSSPDVNVRDPTVIRVVPYMLQDPQWAGVTRRHAGSYLAEKLDHYTGDQDWRDRS